MVGLFVDLGFDVVRGGVFGRLVEVYSCVVVGFG
jgi:hypothetical protein